MIVIENLHKYFKGNEVLKGIDLEIKEGEVVSIVGPSGTGKSTLLRCINYLEQPTKGNISIDGLNIDFEKITRKEIHQLRCKTAMVFQQYNLFKNMTAIENVMEPMVTVQKLKKKEAKEKAEEILKVVGLSDKVNEYPSRLSGGQQQRVGIGRSMAVNSKIILFDEPTSALDPEWVGEVLSVIAKLAKENITMLIVTHEMNFAKSISDKVVFMDGGVIAESGSPDYMFNSCENPRLAQFLRKISN